MNVRLIALDLDGTALDSEGRVRAALPRAIAAAERAGIRVIGCTGRRHRTAAPILLELGIRGPAVVQNGALVKDIESGRTLMRRTLDPALYAPAVEIHRRVSSPLVYVDEAPVDFYFEPPQRAHPHQAEYLRDHGGSGEERASLDTPPPGEIVLISTMADRSSLVTLEVAMRSALGSRALVHRLSNKNYHGDILEVVSPLAGKWAGVLDVCEREGIDPADVMAIGDDQNDAELIERAGLGVAMGNAADAVKAVAQHVTASNEEDGAAIAIERLALGIDR
jgi:Cof subfamily protein (haloacid dehalogenase superfamily)